MKFTGEYIKAALPFLESAPSSFLNSLKENSTAVTIQKGEKILQEDDRCAYVPIVLTGKIRVYRINENARELTLYYIQKGEFCFLSTSCIFSNKTFPAFAITEEYTEALMVPASKMQSWFEEYLFFQKFVCSMASKRLVSLISSISDMAFISLEERLKTFLSEYVNQNENLELSITHQDIAKELGSAREVISRLLKSFEDRGWLSISRGAICLNKAHFPFKKNNNR